MRKLAWRVGIVAAAAAVIGACGGSDGTTHTPVIQIQKAPNLSGDNQTATVQAVLPNAIRVHVTKDGVDMAGATITWTPQQGGANPTTSVTDVDGIASTTWTLGVTAGPESLFAALPLATGSPQLFFATANADQVTSLVRSGGEFQSAVAGTAFALPLGVLARDQFGNGVPGLLINWTVQSGSLVSDANTSLTNAQGLATLVVMAGDTAGPGVMRATTPLLNATTLDFSLTVTPAPKLVTASGVGINVFFTSNTNATANPAVDTIPVGGAMKWVSATGSHSVISSGAPSFPPSGALTASGYTFVFTTAGTYQYECGVHGTSMTGTVVVQ